MTLYNLKRKKSQAAKPCYPATRELFLFVRKCLAARKGVDDPASLRDVEVGSLLAYDYKYTHQWRFGKKRMYDISQLEELSQVAAIPFDILGKVAIGVWDAEQAWTVLQRRMQESHKKWTRKIKLNGVSVEVALDVPADRAKSVDAVLDQVKERLAARIQDPQALFSERQEEIRRFEQFVDDLDLPRISFYRKSK